MFHEGRLTVAPTSHHRDIEEMLVAVKQTTKTVDKFVKTTERSLKSKASRESIEGMKGFIDTDARLFEESVVEAVYEYLEDSEIIQPGRYSYANNSGDVDGVVVGILDDCPCVVFCEAKHNMNKNVSKAIVELTSAEKYWSKLSSLNDNDEEYESCQNDIIALRVDEFKSRKILFAFGGAIFSDSTDEEIRKRFKMPWIKVALKSGRCEVVSSTIC